MNESLREQCLRLLANGSLPRSACRAPLLGFLRPLLDAGVLAEVRSGAGRRLMVVETTAARQFIAARFPDAPAFAGASSRVSSVGEFRDSKVLDRIEPEIVCVRGWKPSVLRRHGRDLDVDAATREHGVFSFLLEFNGGYTLHGPCALVENVSLLIHLERLNLPVGLAGWTRGRMSGDLVSWLAAQTAADLTWLHLPDYDPVGLSEFVRLQRRLGPRIRLHQPADLPERFARFSNRRLLDKANNRALLAGLRRDPPAEIQPVLDLIDRHNAALEQEALLLPL